MSDTNLETLIADFFEKFDDAKVRSDALRETRKELKELKADILDKLHQRNLTEFTTSDGRTVGVDLSLKVVS